ncbi:IclR family transcriptional regulator [Rhodopirellula sp. SWK7]|uniref:IclR family transcriptional regulator n=1 Tax=Rhodopirellula sp. SWK7 TaxID=595460 RepID=UPI0002BE5EA9|nr:helix-turn-helix domain-containing protein [Rhodopirellula sp. SWK7]EMI47460.1 IclR family transcriptional regulator [Rhodopirellula sp. SWK7]
MTVENATRVRGKKAATVKYSVPAFEHGLDLLELLLASPGPLSQTAIANQTGRPISSVFRLLNCLEQRRYVQRDIETGNYGPTMRLYQLAQACPAHQRFRDLAMAPMQDLARKVGESCHLSIREGNQLRVVYNQPSPHMHSLNVSENATYSLVRTTAGKLLLAHLPSDRRERLLESLPEFRECSRREQETLRADLEELGLKKITAVPSQVTPGVLDVDLLLENAWLGDHAVLAVPCIQKYSKNEQKTNLLPTIEAAAEHIVAALKEA